MLFSGREGKARSFIDDIAKLAQNRERFKDLDSKSFGKCISLSLNFEELNLFSRG